MRHILIILTLFALSMADEINISWRPCQTEYYMVYKEVVQDTTVYYGFEDTSYVNFMNVMVSPDSGLYLFHIYSDSMKFIETVQWSWVSCIGGRAERGREVVLYPNPASGPVYAKYLMEVYDILGRKIGALQRGKNFLQLSAGLYFVRYKNRLYKLTIIR